MCPTSCMAKRTKHEKCLDRTTIIYATYPQAQQESCFDTKNPTHSTFKQKTKQKKHILAIKLNGIVLLITDPPPLKLHQKAKSTPSVKWL